MASGGSSPTRASSGWPASSSLGPLRNALDLTTLETTVDDGGTVIDIEVADLGHGTSVHGDLAGRDAPETIRRRRSPWIRPMCRP